MVKRVSVKQPIVFAGSVARNACMVRLLDEALQTRILVPENPQMVGAHGAALLACGIP
jgi:activator of 2-hydroxyglutaryl-CoA dehydratase